MLMLSSYCVDKLSIVHDLDYKKDLQKCFPTFTTEADVNILLLTPLH